MVFALRAEVDARGPLKRFKADAQLYEFKEFEVKLTNPFQVILHSSMVHGSIGYSREELETSMS